VSRVLVCYVGDCPNEVPFVAPGLPVASFMVPARGSKERFVSVWCHDDVEYEDRGLDSPKQRTEHPASDRTGPKGELLPGTARQLLFGSKSDNEGRGYFLAAGEKPTEEELKEAEKKREAYRRVLVGDARFYFQKNRHGRGIGDEAYWAAERMGLEEEWMPLAANPCPNCGMAVKSTAITCRHCNLILDTEKYAQFKFANVIAPAPVQVQRPAQGQR
jgi:hypothetical protein